MKSFRAKMTIMIVLVVLGSTVLLSFISYQRAKSSLIAQMEDNYGAAAQRYALELSSWVSTNATIIDTLAAEIAVNDISFKDYDTFHNYLKHSNDILNKNGYVYDVYFTYPDNFMVCASDFMADGTVDFVHEREWYTTSALTGELFYSTPYLDSDSKKPVITISKAVYKDGDLLGVLAADIFVDVLVDMINNADVEDNSYAFLVDQKMNVIVHPSSKYDYNDNPVNIMSVSGAPYGELVNVIKSGYDDMVFVNDYDGIERGVVYSQMYNTGWYVCIATSQDVLAKGVFAMMRGFVVAAIVAIAIGALTAIFLARVLDKLSKQEQEYNEKVLTLEKQAADEANEAKSRFLADMSHEIRTPINAIIGMNEMILRESDNKDIIGYSRNIKQSGHNLLQLINGILDFSKIEDGKMDIVPVRYRIGEQIAYIFNSISERAKAKNLELKFNIDEKLPAELFGDDTRINQIIMNLLTNAVKYTEEGTVTLSIEGREIREASEITEVGGLHNFKEAKIYYEVKDTGIGIKESDMSKLFESFERLDVVRNRNIEGTGLGMTIVTRLLDLMGSELKVESEYGVGSTFYFELWQRIENDKPLGNYLEAALDDEDDVYQESFRAPEAHILVVDDTNMNILVVQNLLKKTQIKIDTALSGLDSVKLAGEKAYDLILMDQRMPGMDGTEAMKKIRFNESMSENDLEEKHTPIICLTADVISGARERYIEQGFDDYLTKPVEGIELEKMICKYLPKDKIIIDEIKEKNKEYSYTEESFEIDVNKELLSELEKLGVNIEAGIKFCGEEFDMYKSMLEAYANEEKEKSSHMIKSYEAKNWNDYGVYAHSLKSTSRTLGANELADIAYILEMAAKEGDDQTIIENHEKVMELYSKMVNVIREYTNLEKADDGDDEIMEFFPEG